MTDEVKPRRRGALLKTALAALGVIGLLLALEGALSLGSMINAVYRNAQPLPAGHLFTRHDSVLGWTAEPRLRESDAYGDWRPLTTNASGLRGGAGPAEEAADGVYRIVCSGGASTFGVGVADGDTWCSRLGSADPGLETVNAGQPAYGPGQAWLMLRDRVVVKHDLLLFAIDAMDMFKLLSKRDAGFPKPRIEPTETGLKVTNTPIPRRPYLWPWVTFNASLFSKAHVLAPFVTVPPERDSIQKEPIAATVAMSGIIQELEAVAESRGAKLVFAFLPAHPTLQQRAAVWHETVRSELEFWEIPYVDLTDINSAASPAELFDREAQLTDLAHQQVAEALLRELAALDGIEFPEVAGGPWRARYFRDAVFQEEAGVRHHGASSLHWGSGAPLPDMPSDGFSVLLESCLPLDEPARYRVRLEADGHATFSVNRQNVLDTGEGEGQLHRANAVDLPAGGNRLRIRYRDSAGQAYVRLLLENEDGRVVIPGPALVQPPGAADCVGQPRQDEE